jgi:F-type H+-transporting ATPase subunit b
VPQFLPANFLPQLVWLGLIFAVLYFLVIRPTLPKVGKVIDEREGRVSSDIAAAEQAKGEADSIRHAYDAAMAEARAKAQASVGEARSAAGRAVEERMKALAATLDARQDEANSRVEAARTAARAQLDATAAEMTSELVERLTGLKVAPAEAAAALNG